MIETPEVTIEKVSCALGDGNRSLSELAFEALGKLPSTDGVAGVVAATFSNPERFPSLAVRVAAEMGLPAGTPAFDIQMACSAYPYAVYLAGKMSADTGGKVLVVDGDAQTRLVDASDRATGGIFSDAATCSIVSCQARGEDTGRTSRFAFLSRADEALACTESGPIRMDGMKVFTFVATEVSAFLRGFGGDFDWFAPHQANPYMVRQLAKSLGLKDRLLKIDESVRNPGSCSVPMALAKAPPGEKRVLIAGFGAGYSAAAGLVRVL